MSSEHIWSSDWDYNEHYSDSDNDSQLNNCSQPFIDTMNNDQLDGVDDDSETATIESLMELRSIHGSESSISDEEIDSTNIQTSDRQMSFRLGKLYASIDDFYNEVKSYGIHNMYNLKFVRKDGKRCRVKCVGKCPWVIFCSKVGNSETYKVKTFIDSHSCQMEEVGPKFADTKWLSSMVIEDFRKHPKMTGEELKALVDEKYKITISISKAYRVKAYSLQSLVGDVVQQYSKLSSYLEELLRTNPGSSVELLAPKDRQDGPSRFDRIYICIDACKKGFLAGCRPLIALDGCHLTGYYRGQLLAAVGLDGNDGLFIIAYAIVASETRDTWHWFITNLLKDIGETSNRGEMWMFISDQGKGLVAALEELYPSPYHRFCVRHMYSNIQKKWKDEQIRSLFWLAASSTTNNDFDKYMSKLKDKDYTAWEHVTRIGVERWSRAHFQDHVKCHVYSSSIVECFNSLIKRWRDNHVDILIDHIRVKAMTLMRRKKRKVLRMSGMVCPKILNKLNGFIVESTKWHTASCGEVLFEVTLRPQRFVVHLHNHTCTCRLWDLTGIPCVHACAAIRSIKDRPENYVNEYFTREYFLKAYEHEIYPMSGPDFWPKTNYEPIQPPLLKRPPGRPKKQRHKSSLEGKNPHKAKRKYGMIKCGKCGGLGHNKRSCKEGERAQSVGNSSSQASTSSSRQEDNVNMRG